MIKRTARNPKVLIALAVFAAILAAAVGLLSFRTNSLLKAYTESEISNYAASLADCTAENLTTELSSLEELSDYIQISGEDYKQIIKSAGKYCDDGVSMGILKTDGTALCGGKIDFSDFSGIDESFGGSCEVSSCGGELLFTVPVYSEKKVKYVLYRKYEAGSAADSFGVSCYGGNGKALIADGEDNVVVPFGGKTVKQSAAFIDGAEYGGAVSQAREKLGGSQSAAVYSKTKSGKNYVFVSEISGFGLYLEGCVPEAYASEGLLHIITPVMWLFVLLIVLLAAAAAYLFNIEEKVKESGELREAKEAAEKANRAKTDFLANISHEIRTPINAVMGMNEMIMRETDNASVTEYALNINRASHNLLALVNDLLDFSKIEAGKMEIVEHEYLLSSMLNDIVNMIRIKADQKGLRFNVEVDGNLPDRLYGDDVRIRQIAVNLLNNAVKYTPRGEVKLAISGETDKNGVLKLKIAVTDTGIGIKQEDIPLLFRDFQRLDMDKNRTIEGTGLGLAITSRLTERMNGTIGVESVYGKGSTFTAVIPQETRGGETVGDFRYKHKLYIQQKKKYRESFVAPEAKVLAVDDNEMNLYVVKGLLKKSEIRITTCSSGKDALAKMCEEKYDLILLDHMMPGMDGIETLRASKKLEGNLSGGAPVIALTANAVSGVREMYLKEGFDDYLSKPVKSAELEEMMIKYLPAEKVTVTTVRQPEESKISGRQGELIDTATGLVYCAESREMYAEMLRMFADEYADALKLLNGLKNAYDWKNYTVKIHALKSSAKTIGALKLSELCLKLETEGKAASNDIFSQPNIDYIRRNHGKAMGVYEETVAEAKRLAKEMEEDV